jgi:hypothetical protein
MQRLKGSTNSCLIAAITNHLLNMIISQIMLINRNRIATYGNHAGYDLKVFHDYKIVNVIQEYITQTITTSHVSLHLNIVNKPSSISEDVPKIRINSQPCKGNNMTLWHTNARKANEWPPFAMSIKESVRVLRRSSAVLHMKASWAVHTTR